MASTYGNNSYERIKSISEQVRAMSYTFECPVISATQVNRTGYGNNAGGPGLESIGESYGLGATADAIVSILTENNDLNVNDDINAAEDDAVQFGRTV